MKLNIVCLSAFLGIQLLPCSYLFKHLKCILLTAGMHFMKLTTNMENIDTEMSF